MFSSLTLYEQPPIEGSVPSPSGPQTIKFVPVIKLNPSIEVVKATTPDVTFGEYYELIVK